jgi:hypothetical protein
MPDSLISMRAYQAEMEVDRFGRNPTIPHSQDVVRFGHAPAVNMAWVVVGTGYFIAGGRGSVRWELWSRIGFHERRFTGPIDECVPNGRSQELANASRLIPASEHMYGKSRTLRLSNLRFDLVSTLELGF